MCFDGQGLAQKSVDQHTGPIALPVLAECGNVEHAINRIIVLSPLVVRGVGSHINTVKN